MTVANLELCKELYELSGWDFEPDHGLVYWNVHDLKTYEPTLAIRNIYPNNYVPAYDLGYLMRKLPEPILLRKKLNRYEASVRRGNRVWPAFEADTPEDAACKLAIELFRQGILTNPTAVAESNKEKRI